MRVNQGARHFLLPGGRCLSLRKKSRLVPGGRFRLTKSNSLTYGALFVGAGQGLIRTHERQPATSPLNAHIRKRKHTPADFISGKEAMTQSISLPSPRWKQLFGYLALPLVALVWAYWTSLQAIADRWGNDPQYSHGYLVPIFSLALLWLRKDRLNWELLKPSWWGVPLLLLAIGLRGYGAYCHYPYLEHVALLPCVIGLCLVMGGWAAWRWAWPALCFLFFMVPLPFSVGHALAWTASNACHHQQHLCSTNLWTPCSWPRATSFS